MSRRNKKGKKTSKIMRTKELKKKKRSDMKRE